MSMPFTGVTQVQNEAYVNRNDNCNGYMYDRATQTFWLKTKMNASNRQIDGNKISAIASRASTATTLPPTTTTLQIEYIVGLLVGVGTNGYAYYGIAIRNLDEMNTCGSKRDGSIS
ncbi:hypothetical protein BCR33DRAFT_296219 [Rhizoclosmatium globosum]|uniref:Uncharacterized protein n=1 Tax=Rhizoclosmatium globosum TaxID=329046 RepID=A0A1Y2C629_9FUNG|nr:hypothetical protein BCR33DRAFT_296219 [Rhizoclosmatium globosum]|eukprot:ORY42489.1 hypothetical protein BCR33DRAFT_296219 [Rhizoclosmatium globosum]